MTPLRPILATSVVSLASVVAATGEIAHDRVSIAGREYVRTQLRVPFADFGVGARDGVAAVRGFSGNGDATLAHYHRFGQALHAPVMVEPVLAQSAFGLVSSHSGDHTALLWQSWTNPRQMWMRVFNTQGAPIGPAVLVREGLYADWLDWNIRVDGNSIATTILGGTQEIGTRRIYFRYWALTGEPFSSEIPVSLPRGRGGAPATLLIPNAAAVFSCMDVTMQFQRLESDFSYGPPVECAPLIGNIFKRLDDDSILAHYGTWPDVRYLRRFSEYGQPLGAPLSVHPQSRAFPAASDGRFALVYAPESNRLLMQLHDADWLPASDPFDFANLPDTPNHDFSDGGGATYEDDGTIWIGFTAWGGPSAGNYLVILKPYLPADMNLDNRVDNFDIDAFVLALSDPAAYAAQYDVPPDVIRFYGDCNGDGSFDNFDIDAFIECLNNGGCL